MVNGVGRCSAGHQMGSAQSNKWNRNSLGLVKPALTKALTKSLVQPSDTPALASKQFSSLRMEVVQPAKLLMEVKWGVEGLELVNLLEFQQVFLCCRSPVGPRLGWRGAGSVREFVRPPAVTGAGVRPLRIPATAGLSRGRLFLTS